MQYVGNDWIYYIELKEPRYTHMPVIQAMPVIQGFHQYNLMTMRLIVPNYLGLKVCYSWGSLCTKTFEELREINLIGKSA